MQISKIINGFSYALGIALVVMSLISLLMATTATFNPESGKYLAYANSGIFLLLGSACLCYPQFKRYAKFLFTFFLLLLAASTLWLVFSENLNTNKPAIYQAGAIALVVLLIARISSSVRAGRSKSDT